MIRKFSVCLFMAMSIACSTAKESDASENKPKEEEPQKEITTCKAFTFFQLSDAQLAFHTGDALEFTEDTTVLNTMVSQINRLRPDFVLMTGDMTDNSTNKAQLDAYRKVISRVDRDIPLYHLPGNHDVGSACSDAKVAAFESNYGPDKFSFVYENCAIIGLNTCAIFSADPSSGEPSAEAAARASSQYDWLVAQLDSTASCNARIVFGHYPVFVKSFGEERSSNNFSLEEREKYWTLFKRHKVAAFGCGHTHYPYESSYLGIDAVTCGALAAPLGNGYRGGVVWKVSETGKVTHSYISVADFVAMESL